MSKKFAVVPLSYFESHSKSVPAIQSSSPPESSTIKTHESSDKSFINYLPKNIRSKAAVVLEYLKDKLNVNEDGEITYHDGVLGGHIYEQLKYYLSNAQFKGKRPLTAEKFAKLAESGPIKPQGSSSVIKWKTLYK